MAGNPVFTFPRHSRSKRRLPGLLHLLRPTRRAAHAHRLGLSLHDSCLARRLWAMMRLHMRLFCLTRKGTAKDLLVLRNLWRKPRAEGNHATPNAPMKQSAHVKKAAHIACHVMRFHQAVPEIRSCAIQRRSQASHSTGSALDGLTGTPKAAKTRLEEKFPKRSHSTGPALDGLEGTTKAVKTRLVE